MMNHGIETRRFGVNCRACGKVTYFTVETVFPGQPAKPLVAPDGTEIRRLANLAEPSPAPKSIICSCGADLGSPKQLLH